jgi:hypothetical protein
MYSQFDEIWGIAHGLAKLTIQKYLRNVVNHPGDEILSFGDKQVFLENDIFDRLGCQERKQPRLQLLSFCRVTFGCRYLMKLAVVAISVPEKIRLLVESVAEKIYCNVIIFFKVGVHFHGVRENSKKKTPRGTAVIRPSGRGTLRGMCAGGRLPGRVRFKVVRR